MIEKQTQTIYGIKNDTILAWHLFINAKNNPNKRFIHVCEKNTDIYTLSFLLSFFNELYETHIPISKLRKDSLCSSEVFTVFQSSSSGIILLHREYCDEYFPSFETVETASFHIVVGAHHSPQYTGEKLVTLGYERVSHTPNHGEFSIQGSLMEFYESVQNKDKKIQIYFDEHGVEKISINNTDAMECSIPPRFIDALPHTEPIFSIC
jgi:transcription-repair coupling factor (superfamily II helicase)